MHPPTSRSSRVSDAAWGWAINARFPRRWRARWLRGSTALNISRCRRLAACNSAPFVVRDLGLVGVQARCLVAVVPASVQCRGSSGTGVCGRASGRRNRDRRYIRRCRRRCDYGYRVSSAETIVGNVSGVCAFIHGHRVWFCADVNGGGDLQCAGVDHRCGTTSVAVVTGLAVGDVRRVGALVHSHPKGSGRDVAMAVTC